ncbi:hypothetical protein FSC37_12815 [Piscinibacter aquaticus]|uniref:Uncharacterized protein n=1 Tax=Piscinibacter aquaticus TaxID=392597 RepID=A0A5C6U1G4_9BURK|nr:hypothetical protein FSC37_12815 [Piscinibacter aquaticus]
MTFNRSRTALIVAQALAAMTLAACGGADQPTDETLVDGTELEQAERLRWRAVDSTAPSLAVLNKTVDQTNGLAGLGGSVTDNKRIYRVRWANDRGGSGTAKLSGTYYEATGLRQRSSWPPARTR